MKKYMVFLGVVLIFTAVLGGCVEAHYGISDGIYAVAGKPDAPQIRFDIGNGERTFCYVTGNALPLNGTFEIENGYVKGSSGSDHTEYVFEIKDNCTIRFCREKSSVLYLEDGVTSVDDGTEFILLAED